MGLRIPILIEGNKTINELIQAYSTIAKKKSNLFRVDKSYYIYDGMLLYKSEKSGQLIKDIFKNNFESRVLVEYVSTSYIEE